MFRSKLEMAAVLAALDEAKEDGLTPEQLADRTKLGKYVDRAIYYLKKEGWVTAAGKDGRLVVTPDQREPSRSR